MQLVIVPHARSGSKVELEIITVSGNADFSTSIVVWEWAESDALGEVETLLDALSPRHARFSSQLEYIEGKYSC